MDTKVFIHGDKESEGIQNGFTHGFRLDSYMDSESNNYGVRIDAYFDSE